MEKISVIIPVYNVEAYIEKCLNSVISQYYQNLEMICIDDGSTDNSGKICEQYAARDERIRVIHQPNLGVGSARNAGLKNCTGKYIGFVDSDDWIEPHMYETLYNLVKDNKVSLGTVNYFMDTDTDSTPIVNRKQIPKGEISTEDIIFYSFKKDDYKGFGQTLWNKLFLSDSILNNKLFFREDIKYGEDTLFYSRILSKGKVKGAYCDKPLYHYYKRDSSVSNFNPADNGADAIFVYKSIIELFEREGYESVNIWVKRFHCYFASLFAEMALKNNDYATLKRMRNEIKKYLNEYIETNKEFPDRIRRINRLIK